jgi:hypothetical protein
MKNSFNGLNNPKFRFVSDLDEIGHYEIINPLYAIYGDERRDNLVSKGKGIGELVRGEE